MARFEAFWDVVCEYHRFLWMGLAMMIFFLILSIMGLLFAPRGTGAYAISILNLGMVVLAGSVLLWMNWVCSKRRSEYA